MKLPNTSEDPLNARTAHVQAARMLLRAERMIHADEAKSQVAIADAWTRLADSLDSCAAQD